MNQTEARRRFLRSAIKTGMRMQERFVAESGTPTPGREEMRSEGVATIQQIRASLRKRSAKLPKKEHP